MAKRGSIDRAAVLDAAYSVAQRVGLNGLTMRMVADELGVSPMAAYRHVADRDTLVSLVADRLASTVEVPAPDSGPWDERLRRLERAAFRAAVEVRGQPDAVVLTWGPNHVRIVDGMLAILEDAGFDEDLPLVFEVIWAYVLGQVRVYENLAARRDAPADGEATNAYPLLARVLARVPPASPEEHFDRGFEIVLDGLRQRLAAKRAPSVP